MEKLTSFFLLVLISLIASSCASKNGIDYKKFNEVYSKQNHSSPEHNSFKTISEIPKFEDRKYLVSPGFLFRISHPTDEKLRGKFRVDFDGTLRLPYNIRIDVTNKTFGALKVEVEKSYEKFFQAGAPSVSLSLLYKHYYVEVRGFVKNSGRYLVTRKTSIDKVIDKAGGLKGNLKNDFFSASIKQQDQTYSISLNQYFQNNNFAKTFTWTGGDTIFINLLGEDTDSSSVPVVTVMGGVKNPGKTLYKEDSNLYYYLSKAGGTIPSVSFEEAYVIRQTKDGLARIDFDLMDMDSIPVVYPNDIILLNSEKDSKSDKIMDRISRFLQILTSIAVLKLAYPNGF